MTIKTIMTETKLPQSDFVPVLSKRGLVLSIYTLFTLAITGINYAQTRRHHDPNFR